jgi:hypothetical protein
MLNQMLDQFLIIIVISLCATAWVLLCMGGELLDFVPRWVQKVTMNAKINKVLYQCEKCAAGQIAFWYQIHHSYTQRSFIVIDFMCFVLASITVTTVVGAFVFQIKNKNGR